MLNFRTTSFFVAAVILKLALTTSAAFAFDVPTLSGPVMDQVGLLSPSVRNELNQVLLSLRQKNRIQLQVLIVPDLQGEDISTAAIKVFDQWKLGDEKKDNGLLFLIAMNERKNRFEVGRGLEGDFPDVIAKRILSERVRPLMKDRRYDEAVLVGVLSAIEKLDPEFLKDPSVAQWTQQQSRGSASGKWNGNLVIVILFILFVVFKVLFFSFGGIPSSTYGRRDGYGGGWGSGGSGWGGGGGGWSGGGGGSAGGGASDGW